MLNSFKKMFDEVKNSQSPQRDVKLLRTFVEGFPPVEVVHDYGIIGLRSDLLTQSEDGRVRVFTMTKHQHGDIAPHNHRYGFECLVLAGEVQNTIWHRNWKGNEATDMAVFHQEYLGEPGKYQLHRAPDELFSCSTTTYQQGQSYQMRADQIHHIRFSRGARVLFIEGREDPYLLEDDRPVTTVLANFNHFGEVLDPMPNLRFFMGRAVK